MLKWIIRLLDHRLWNGAGQGGGGGGGAGQGGGGPGGDGGPDQGGGGEPYGGQYTPPVPAPAPVAAPPPPPPKPGEPGWEWAANRQTANIDRSSQFTQEQYTSELDAIYAQSTAAGAGMGPGAYDYELPDMAFGQRLY